MRNKVELIGVLEKDPEFRTFEDGNQIATLRVRTWERWKDKGTGENKSRATWHTVEVGRQGTVKAIEKFLKKGSRVLVSGALRYEEFTDNEGVKRYFTKIIVKGPQHECNFLDPRADDHPPAEEGQDEPGSNG